MTRRTHPRVDRWLQNFPADQRETAGLLVEAINLVSATELRQALGNKIRELLTTLRVPVAALPVREGEPRQSAHAPGREGDYQLFDPGLPGSEALIANMLTGVSREAAFKEKILTDFDLPMLRSHQVRTLLLVDDFSGSGKRLIDFGRALRRHATIRSWASFHWIDVHVVAFAATNEAARLLRSHYGGDKVHLVLACPTFDSMGWTKEERNDVEELCRMHAQSRKMALGFKRSRALIAFEHTAPNNLPVILWQSNPPWQSLFEGKAVPTDLLTLYGSAATSPVASPTRVAASERLGQLLGLYRNRVRDDDQIAQASGFSYAEIRRLAEVAKSLGLATETRRLTDQGLLELKRWQAVNALAPLPNNTVPYYPRQLRAGR